MFFLYAKYVDEISYVAKFFTSEAREQARVEMEEDWKKDPDFIGFVNGEDVAASGRIVCDCA